MALATILCASPLMTGAIIGLSNYLHPAGPQQPMLPPGTVIIIPGTPAK
jgi:hypothetical protein